MVRTGQKGGRAEITSGKIPLCYYFMINSTAQQKSNSYDYFKTTLMT